MTERWKNSPNIRLLHCLKCGSKLSGLASDRLFFCCSCRLAYDMKEQSESRVYPVTFANLKYDTDIQTVWLPVWRFKLKQGVFSEDSVSELTQPDSIWIFGFMLKRLQLYGNVYAEFNKLDSKPVFDGKAQKVIGAELNEEQARRLVRPVLMSITGHHVTVDHLDHSTGITQSALRAIPFYVRPDSLVYPMQDFAIKRVLICFNDHLDQCKR